MRAGTISIHRAQRISRLPRHEQRDVLKGRKKLPKEMSPQVNGYVAGYRDALSAAAVLAKAAGHRSLPRGSVTLGALMRLRRHRWWLDATTRLLSDEPAVPLDA